MCVYRNNTKCCIALPTDADFERVFEKTLIRGFSCVNKKFAFDSDILLSDPDKEKVLIELNINRKSLSSKILKMDESNQYGQAMTKPLPYGCIKKKDKFSSLTEFSKILDSISHEDNIGHLFTVDIKFHKINEKTLLFNELYPPILEKNKNTDPFERSTLQIMSILVRDEEKEKISSFSCNSKTHSTLKEKKVVRLYAKNLHFLITRAGWLVTTSMLTIPLNSQNLKKSL